MIGRDELSSGTDALKRRGADVADRAQKTAEARLTTHPHIAAIVLLARNVIVRQSVARASLAAAGTAFWLVLAIVPALLSVICIFGLVIDPQTVVTYLHNLTTFDNASVPASITTQLQQFAEGDQTSLSIGLIVSLTITLWSVSAATYSLARTIRLAYGLAPETYIKVRLKSLLSATMLVIGLGLIAIVSTVVVVANNRVTGIWQVLLTGLVEIPIGIAVMTFLIICSYRYSLATKTGLRPLLPGAVGTAFALLILVVGFNIYLANFASYSEIYGASAAAVVVLILFYLSMYVFVIGAIANDVLLEVPESRPWSWLLGNSGSDAQLNIGEERAKNADRELK